jgi:hypothetical protein
VPLLFRAIAQFHTNIPVMRSPVLACGFFLLSALLLLRAGSVTVLGNDPTLEGKLTLGSSSIQVQGTSAPVDVPLENVLEADFADGPFQLNYFSSLGNTGDKLPAGWKAQYLAPVDNAGFASYTNGRFTVGGSGAVAGQLNNSLDEFYFVGTPWSGDGQWTARLKEIDAGDPGSSPAEAGILLREGWKPQALQVWAGATFRDNGGNGQIGNYHFRRRDLWTQYGNFVVQQPMWFRLSRSGDIVILSSSTDGKEWEVIYELNEMDIKDPSQTWVGFYFDSHTEKLTGKAVFDEVSFTPPPNQAESIAPGILLCSGSFLAGRIGQFDATTGTLVTNSQTLTIPTAQVAAIDFNLLARSLITGAGNQSGLIMRNGDFLAGNFEKAYGDMASLSSLVFGITVYPAETVGACVLHPVQSLPSAYEVRLQDGSILRAKNVSVDKNQCTIEDNSGFTVKVPTDNIAQVRAGLSRVQPLIDLPWKVLASSVAPGTTKAASDANSLVQNWIGKNQEQILALPPETRLDVPLKGKYKALAFRVAVPGGAPDQHVILHVQVNGQEIYASPPIRSGDEPVALRVPIKNAQNVTFVADSVLQGIKIFLIDPVAIRED